MEGSKIDKLPDFITFDKRGEPKLIGSLLAKHVRENLFYKIVRDNGRRHGDRCAAQAALRLFAVITEIV